MSRLVALLCLPTAVASAQGVLARAAQRIASMSADVALTRAASIDVPAAGGVSVPFGDLQAAVPTVDLVPGVVVRLHLFLRNTGEAAVTLPVPPDSAFVLVDGTGRRLPRVSVRVREGAAQGVLTVPPLERSRFELVFTLDKAATGEAALKVGAATVIRGIPLTQGEVQAAAPTPTATPPAAPPATPPAAPPAAPPDTVIPPRSAPRRLALHHATVPTQTPEFP
ncbi:MAG: hypothetical protein IT355_13555 [Gemmatimonadaceae bacterium]|nr:hypothetical protein [Gemmatimonadaceae bacterium]